VAAPDRGDQGTCWGALVCVDARMGDGDVWMGGEFSGEMESLPKAFCGVGPCGRQSSHSSGGD
jgi:hypothetical protein